MTEIKVNPKECPHCKSPFFFNDRTTAHQYPLGNIKQITIDRNYFCDNCKKYFFSKEKTTVDKDLYKSCNHSRLERSTNFLNFPEIHSRIHAFFLVSLCLNCGAYLLTCDDIKNNLEDAWPDFWGYSWFNPFLYHPLMCNYCSGQSFEDTSLEIYHARPRALVLLKREDDGLFKFFFGGEDSGICKLEANIKKETKLKRKRKIYREIEDKEKEFSQYLRKARNYYREKFNLPKIGEGWISETKLFELVKKYFQDCKVYFHFRQSWLNGLELDIFVPDKNLAIEYMGKQHYEPVKFFGGKKSHLAIVERDKIKKEICEKNGIDLIYFDYQTEVTKENLKIIFEGWKKKRDEKIL